MNTKITLVALVAGAIMGCSGQDNYRTPQFKGIKPELRAGVYNVSVEHDVSLAGDRSVEPRPFRVEVEHLTTTSGKVYKENCSVLRHVDKTTHFSITDNGCDSRPNRISGYGPEGSYFIEKAKIPDAVSDKVSGLLQKVYTKVKEQKPLHEQPHYVLSKLNE